MCRLFGFRASAPTCVEQALFSDRNSLCEQSRAHEDGWGIVTWHASQTPAAAHSVRAAHVDPEFHRLSRTVSARTLLAHVRKASVGAVERCNAHPFVHGPWAFAHNGTVERFSRHKEQLEALVSPPLRRHIRGETDSERCFYLVLTELEQLCSERPTVLHIAQALARTMVRVAALTDVAGQPPSSLNFLLTDGEVMVASRRGRTLHVAEREGDGRSARQVLIASEELSSCAWRAIPDNAVLGVDRDLSLHHWNLGDLLG